jgi:hypothetical protein
LEKPFLRSTLPRSPPIGCNPVENGAGEELAKFNKPFRSHLLRPDDHRPEQEHVAIAGVERGLFLGTSTNELWVMRDRRGGERASVRVVPPIYGQIGGAPLGRPTRLSTTSARADLAKESCALAGYAMRIWSLYDPSLVPHDELHLRISACVMPFSG